MTDKEEWKDIKGYEGLYQVSNLGRIKSVERKVKYQNSFRTVKEKTRKTFIGKNGYERIELSKDGINKKYNVHRIVAKTFIPNPENKPEVNHINGNKEDNRVENLEWVTSKENQIHAYKIELQRPSEKQKNIVSEYCRKHKVKKIIQLSIDNKFIKEWESAVEVEKCLGISRKNISQCITGKNKTAGGFKWVTHEQFASIEYKIEEDK